MPLFPAASELVMLYAGALAAGVFGTHGVTLFGSRIGSGAGAFVALALAGTLGYLVGALIGWAIGRYGGRPLLERHGGWFHLSPARLDRAEAWFARWGPTVCWSAESRRSCAPSCRLPQESSRCRSGCTRC